MMRGPHNNEIFWRPISRGWSRVGCPIAYDMNLTYSDGLRSGPCLLKTRSPRLQASPSAMDGHAIRLVRSGAASCYIVHRSWCRPLDIKLSVFCVQQAVPQHSTLATSAHNDLRSSQHPPLRRRIVSPAFDRTCDLTDLTFFHAASALSTPPSLSSRNAAMSTLLRVPTTMCSRPG